MQSNLEKALSLYIGLFNFHTSSDRMASDLSYGWRTITCDLGPVQEMISIPLPQLVSFLWASINKILASILGLGLALVSLIPVPRLRQWCPPQMAIFDALIAITIGIVLYVLILWAVVSFLGSVTTFW